jgi:mannose-1-phosphate guanylyltransferase
LPQALREGKLGTSDQKLGLRPWTRQLQLDRTGRRSFYGGDGTRLREMTQKIAGFHLPKQFCVLLGEIPLLEQTRRRVSLSLPSDLTFFALNRDHEGFFSPLLTDVSPRNLVVQPRSRGTAPAILYSLLRLAEVVPGASVLLMPSDHHVGDEAALMRYVDLAFATVERRPELTLLLGIAPDDAETAYGWIEPGPTLGEEHSPVFQVRRFWEKPSRELAGTLLEQGCLWNSFMIVRGLFIVAMPELYLSFSKIRPSLGTVFEEETVGRVYEHLRASDFSRHVLESAALNLSVLPVSNVGWCDLGEPDRVAKTLASLGIRQKWAAA